MHSDKALESLESGLLTVISVMLGHDLNIPIFSTPPHPLRLPPKCTSNGPEALGPRCTRPASIKIHPGFTEI